MFFKQYGLLPIHLFQQSQQVPIPREKLELLDLSLLSLPIGDQWGAIESQTLDGESAYFGNRIKRAIGQGQEMRFPRLLPWIPQNRVARLRWPIIKLVQVAAHAGVQQVVEVIRSTAGTRSEMI